MSLLSQEIRPGRGEVRTRVQSRELEVGSGRRRPEMLASSFPKERTVVSADDIGVHGIVHLLDTDGVAVSGIESGIESCGTHCLSGNSI